MFETLHSCFCIYTLILPYCFVVHSGWSFAENCSWRSIERVGLDIWLGISQCSNYTFFALDRPLHLTEVRAFAGSPCKMSHSLLRTILKHQFNTCDIPSSNDELVKATLISLFSLHCIYPQNFRIPYHYSQLSNPFLWLLLHVDAKHQ